MKSPSVKAAVERVSRRFHTNFAQRVTFEAHTPASLSKRLLLPEGVCIEAIRAGDLSLPFGPKVEPSTGTVLFRATELDSIHNAVVDLIAEQVAKPVDDSINEFGSKPQYQLHGLERAITQAILDHQNLIISQHRGVTELSFPGAAAGGFAKVLREILKRPGVQTARDWIARNPVVAGGAVAGAATGGALLDNDDDDGLLGRTAKTIGAAAIGGAAGHGADRLIQGFRKRRVVIR